MRQEAAQPYARGMRIALPLLAVALAAGCNRPPPEPRATVEHAMVILPAVPGRPGAAYFTLRTNNDPTRLTGIASARIGRIELHETLDRDGVSRMVPLHDPAFSPAAPLAFTPGRRHAMLFEVDPSLRPGDRVPLTFSFEPAPAVTVSAEVRAAVDQGAH